MKKKITPKLVADYQRKERRSKIITFCVFGAILFPLGIGAMLLIPGNWFGIAVGLVLILPPFLFLFEKEKTPEEASYERERDATTRAGFFGGLLLSGLFEKNKQEDRPAWDNEDFQEMEDDIYDETVDDDDNELW